MWRYLGPIHCAAANCRRRLDGLVTILLWGTTLWGILYKSIATKVNHKLSLIVYLVMGWIGIIFLPIIIIRTSWLFILFIFLGGLSYTIGAWFYAQRIDLISI